MKKIIVAVIVIIGIGWCFRYSLIRPFVNTSNEKVLVSNFMENCVSNISDLQKIESLAQSNGWRPLTDQEATLFRLTPNGSYKGWEMPNKVDLVISIDVLPQQGKTAFCSVAVTAVSDELALSMLESYVHLGSKYQDKKLSPMVSLRGWYNEENGLEIGLMTYNVKGPSFFSLRNDVVLLTAGKAIH